MAVSMRDHDQTIQDLKKENFDLKLRLYALSENESDGETQQISEYEHQLREVLGRIEAQQKLFEIQTRELSESKEKEKVLLKKQRNLENECKLRDERIQNLSQSVQNLSASMSSLSHMPSSERERNAVSMYLPETDSEDEYPDGGRRDYSAPVPPRLRGGGPGGRRDFDRDTMSLHDEEARLMGNATPVRNSFSSTTSDPTSRIIKNYYNTTVNQSRYRNDGCDNIAVVKPSNFRTVVNSPQNEKDPVPVEQTRKKKKGFRKLFSLCCSGKSGQRMSRGGREGSVYQKRPVSYPAQLSGTDQNHNFSYDNPQE